MPALVLVQALATLAMTLPSLSADRKWDVAVRTSDSQRIVLSVSETEPILKAVERAGLMPGSDCRRGNCLSCAARILKGAPFSLRVDGCTALCEEAHQTGLVLLCSAFAVGPGLEMALDADGDAWDIQYNQRWRPDAPALPPKPPAPTHFRLPEDAVELFERCASLPDGCDVDESNEDRASR